MSKIGLKTIRESLLIRKTELARMANISPMTVARIEQGQLMQKENKTKGYFGVRA